MTQTSKLDIILDFIKKGTGGKDATKSLKGLDQATKGADKSTRRFSLGQAAAAIGLTALTLNVIRQLPELAQLGFRYENARIALEAYTGSAQSATDVTDAISEASGFAVSKMEAVANATRIVSLGLVSNAEEAAEFTRVAVTLGATMGKDVQGAFEEFSLLLANESILRLDTYGISGAKVREEMARLASVFPEMDRNARFTNATMTIAAEKMDKLDEAGFQATSAIDRMTARLGDAKVEFASFANEVAANLLNPIFDTADAHKEASVAILENVDTYQEYKAALTEAGIVGGLFTDSTASLSEEQFNQAKAAQAAAVATAELSEAERLLLEESEKVILTQGGINELLQEQEFLAKALSLGIAGSLTKAYEKVEQGQLDFLDTEAEIIKESIELTNTYNELGVEIAAISDSYATGGRAQREYTIAVNDVRFKQADLNKKLSEGKISVSKFNNEMDKTNLTMQELTGSWGDHVDQMQELRDEQEKVDEQIGELNDQWDEAIDKQGELEQSLRRATAELIFQSAAADLDAQTSLLLARELGLVDEATFAVAQSAQALRIQYDEGAISAEVFTGEAGNLAVSVAQLQDRDVTISIDTLQANNAINTLRNRWSALGLTLSDAWANILVDIQSQIPDISGLNFQGGGQFMIPDTGAFGDVNPVAFNAERGETVTITPRDGSPPGGGGGGPLIGTVNVGSDTDLSFLVNELQKSRR